ncbi:MAG: dihydroorotase [Spirochaetia bacterium]|jgi:allantoinase|nr:dihydroorotase [Spirochaetia bacterium]
MSGDLLVTNGLVVSSAETVAADILVKDGRIEALLRPGTQAQADQKFDAAGRYVIPGGVDGHTHMMDPGYTDREEFETGTMAAGAGGITTIVDHHRTIPAVYSLEPHLQKVEYLNKKACVDFGLKGGISPDNVKELEAMWNAGITGFKTFTCNLHGVKAMYSGFLMRSFTEVARIGGTVLIHCEDDGICQYNEETLKEQGRTDYASQWEWRSKLAERVAVQTVIAIAKQTRCRTNIAHVSQPELLEHIHEAWMEGYEIYAETCPHYFYLTPDDLKKRGPWVKFTPPMNTAEKRDRLWELFNRGYITTIGSDHCPYPKEQKAAGEKNIWDAPNGIPGIDTSLKLMLNGVNQGRTTINRLVECMCEKPAKLYGLYPRKGHIHVGADADMVVVDMAKEETLSNEKVLSKCKWTPFDGWNIRGVPHTVFLRGRMIAQEGKFTGTVGYGQFVPRGTPCLGR